MIEFAASFVAVVLAFVFGMFVERKRSMNFSPIDRKEYDERWIYEPPPAPLGGSVGEKPPTTIIHLHAPWRK